jgi:hypothetical protein
MIYQIIQQWRKDADIVPVQGDVVKTLHALNVRVREQHQKQRILEEVLWHRDLKVIPEEDFWHRDLRNLAAAARKNQKLPITNQQVKKYKGLTEEEDTVQEKEENTKQLVKHNEEETEQEDTEQGGEKEV